MEPRKRIPGLLAAACLVAAIAAVGAAPASAQAPSQPTQPPDGPGGAAHRWKAMNVVFHDNADDGLDYWTYEPRTWGGKPKNKPKRVPVVFFLHGYGGMSPVAYPDWIEHIVERGSILVYPRYQASLTVPTSTYTPNAIASLQAAVPWLRQNAQPKPSLRHGVNVIGHSYGGAVATNVAARAASSGLPKPASVLLANPFVENASYKPPIDAIDPDLSGIPRRTKLDCVVADIDSLAGRLGCDEVFSRIGHIGPRDRGYIWMYGDDHGSPPLVVSHTLPSVRSDVDAFDFFGYWKLADALSSCTLDDEDCNHALGGGRKERFMGRWSDGKPVRKLDVFTRPPPCPPGSQAYGC